MADSGAAAEAVKKLSLDEEAAGLSKIVTSLNQFCVADHGWSDFKPVNAISYDADPKNPYLIFTKAVEEKMNAAMQAQGIADRNVGLTATSNAQTLQDYVAQGVQTLAATLKEMHVISLTPGFDPKVTQGWKDKLTEIADIQKNFTDTLSGMNRDTGVQKGLLDAQQALHAGLPQRNTDIQSQLVAAETKHRDIVTLQEPVLTASTNVSRLQAEITPLETRIQEINNLFKAGAPAQSDADRDKLIGPDGKGGEKATLSTQLTAKQVELDGANKALEKVQSDTRAPVATAQGELQVMLANIQQTLKPLADAHVATLPDEAAKTAFQSLVSATTADAVKKDAIIAEANTQLAGLQEKHAAQLKWSKEVFEKEQMLLQSIALDREVSAKGLIGDYRPIAMNDDEAKAFKEQNTVKTGTYDKVKYPPGTYTGPQNERISFSYDEKTKEYSATVLLKRPYSINAFANAKSQEIDILLRGGASNIMMGDNRKSFLYYGEPTKGLHQENMAFITVALNKQLDVFVMDKLPSLLVEGKEGSRALTKEERAQLEGVRNSYIVTTNNNEKGEKGYQLHYIGEDLKVHTSLAESSAVRAMLPMDTLSTRWTANLITTTPINSFQGDGASPVKKINFNMEQFGVFQQHVMKDDEIPKHANGSMITNPKLKLDGRMESLINSQHADGHTSIAQNAEQLQATRLTDSLGNLGPKKTSKTVDELVKCNDEKMNPKLAAVQATAPAPASAQAAQLTQGGAATVSVEKQQPGSVVGAVPGGSPGASTAPGQITVSTEAAPRAVFLMDNVVTATTALRVAVEGVEQLVRDMAEKLKAVQPGEVLARAKELEAGVQAATAAARLEFNNLVLEVNKIPKTETNEEIIAKSKQVANRYMGKAESAENIAHVAVSRLEQQHGASMSSNQELDNVHIGSVANPGKNEAESVEVLPGLSQKELEEVADETILRTMLPQGVAADIHHEADGSKQVVFDDSHVCAAVKEVLADTGLRTANPKDTENSFGITPSEMTVFRSADLAPIAEAIHAKVNPSGPAPH